MIRKAEDSYRLTALGVPALEWVDGRQIRLEDKRLALLLFLVLAPPRGFRRRDSVLPVFWPELGQAAARHALRQSLYVLRSTMGPTAIVTRGREEIALRGDSIRCDVLEFERCLDAQDSLAAAEMYRGEFLDGFHIDGISREFEDWLDCQRAVLRGKAMGAFRDAAIQKELTGSEGEALMLLRRAHVIDPTDEGVVRQLIQLLDRQGDRSGALELYQSFARLIRREYSSMPAPETRAIAAGVRETEGELEAGRVGPPKARTSLVGREAEIEALTAALSRDDERWITLTGPAGVGKTRLAIEGAMRWKSSLDSDVVFVSLAGVRDVEQVLPMIAQAFGLQSGDQDHVKRVRGAIGAESILLVVDNLEHLVASAPSIARLLDDTHLRILATSRSPLHIEVEREVPVGVLSLPDPSRRSALELVAQSTAVRLFVERAVAVRPGFRLDDENAAAVTEVCRRLDGLPLAIELAAARIRVLSPRAISDRLEKRLALLTGGPQDVSARHRCLADTIAWSYDLLSEEEREALSWISLFPAGCDLDVLAGFWVEQGGTDDQALDLATSLVEKSLAIPMEVEGAEPRFTMLETIREFALQQAAMREEMVRWVDRYIVHWVDWAERGTRHYCSDRQPEWLRRVDAEHDNLRAALRRAGAREEQELAGRLGSALWWFWWTRGYMAEGRAWLDRLHGSDALSAGLRARILQGAGTLARGQGDTVEGARLLAEGLEVQRSLNDPPGLSMALRSLGSARMELDELEGAEALFSEALELDRNLRNEHGIAAALNGLGRVMELRGDGFQARSLFEESFSLAQRLGDDHRMAQALFNLASVEEQSGDLETAEVLYHESGAHFRAIHATLGVAESLVRLGQLARRAGSYERSREQFVEALGLYREVGNNGGIVTTLIGIAGLNLAIERADRTARLCGGIESMVATTGARLESPTRAEWDAVTAAARERLGERAFRERWLKGRRMSLEDTIVIALQLAPAGRRTRTVKKVQSG